MALKAAAVVNQAAANINLGVKAITNMKKSAKATKDIKPLKSTLTRSVDWPDFRTIKMVKLFSVMSLTENQLFCSFAGSDLQAISFQFFNNKPCILIVFVCFFHVVCKISNFNMWTVKHLAQVNSVQELSWLYQCIRRK